MADILETKLNVSIDGVGKTQVEVVSSDFRGGKKSPQKTNDPSRI